MSISHKGFLSLLHSVRTNHHWVVPMIALLFMGAACSDVTALTVRAGYPQLNGGQTPLWLIADAKIDRQFGLDFKPVYITGGVRLTQAVISGDVEIAMTGGAAVNAMLSGADLIYVAMPVSTYAFSLYTRSDIKQVPDLRGKVIGVVTKGASSDHASIALLRQYKMAQGQDVKVLYFSRQQDVLAALNQGIIAAGVLSAPTTLMARRLGFKELVNIGALKLAYPFTGVAVQRSELKQNPEPVRAFLKSYIVALRMAREQPELSKRALSHFLATEDPDIIDEAYRSFVPLFPRVPYVTDEAIRAVLSITDHPKAPTADPTGFYDNGLLKELENGGFVKKVYGSR